MWYLAEARYKEINAKQSLVDGYRFLVRNIDSADPANDMRLELERQLDKNTAIVGDPHIMVSGPYMNAEEAMSKSEDANITFGED